VVDADVIGALRPRQVDLIASDGVATRFDGAVGGVTSPFGSPPALIVKESVTLPTLGTKLASSRSGVTV